MRHAFFIAVAYVAAANKLDFAVYEHNNTFEVTYAKGEQHWAKHFIKDAIRYLKEEGDLRGTPNGATDTLIVQLTEGLRGAGLCE